MAFLSVSLSSALRGRCSLWGPAIDCVLLVRRISQLLRGDDQLSVIARNVVDYVPRGVSAGGDGSNALVGLDYLPHYGGGRTKDRWMLLLLLNPEILRY